MDKLTGWQAFFNLALWGIILFTLYPTTKYPYRLLKSRKYIGLFFILLFCLYPFFGGDYFHYMETYSDAKLKGSYYHLEDVYVWIIQNLCNSYFQFRLIVWGCALLLIVVAYRRLETNSDLPLFYFGVFYLPWFSYARVSLAMALIFYGLSILVKPPKRFVVVGYVISLLALGSSLFFHRSAFIGIIASMGALFLRNPKKKTIFIIIAIFPVLMIILESLLNDFMSFDLGYDDYITGRLRDSYLTNENSTGLGIGIGPYISVFFTRAPLFVIAVTYVYCVIKGYFKELEKSNRIISSYAFLIVLISFIFFVNPAFNTYVLYYRTLFFAMIPSAVFLTQLKKSGKVPQLYKLVCGSTIFGVFYTLLYALYSSML